MIDRVELISGNSVVWLFLKSKLAFARRDLATAEHFARLAVDAAPDMARGYDALGMVLEQMEQGEEAAEVKAIHARLDPRPNTYFKWLVSLSQLNDRGRTIAAAREALPVFNKYLALNPRDQHLAVQLTHVYLWADQEEKARTLGMELLKHAGQMDSKVLYNLGCVFGNIGDIDNAVRALKASVEGGFTNLYQIRTWEKVPGFLESSEFRSIVDSLSKTEQAPSIPANV